MNERVCVYARGTPTKGEKEIYVRVCVTACGGFSFIIQCVLCVCEKRERRKKGRCTRMFK